MAVDLGWCMDVSVGKFLAGVIMRIGIDDVVEELVSVSASVLNGTEDGIEGVVKEPVLVGVVVINSVEVYCTTG